MPATSRPPLAKRDTWRNSIRPSRSTAKRTRPLDAPRSTAATHSGEFSTTYRKKAAATPESTGMCAPVVRARSPPSKAKTALAMLSGRTSRFKRVRPA